MTSRKPRPCVLAEESSRLDRLAATVHAAVPDARVYEARSVAEARRQVLEAGVDWLLVDLPKTHQDADGLLSAISDLTLEVPVITLADSQDNAVGIAGLRLGTQEHVARRGLNGPRLRRALTHARERHARQRALLDRAFTDPLTGLPNRALFLDHVRHALARAPRGDGTVAVLFIDLDHFKPINDTYGHAMGDRVLAAFARHLLGSLRPSDTVARYGGDEFTILCEDAGTADDVLAVAQRVVSIATTPLKLGTCEFTLQVSVGVAFSSDAAAVADDLVARADAAMYYAKAHSGLAVSEPSAASPRSGTRDRSAFAEGHSEPHGAPKTGRKITGDVRTRTG